MYMCIEALIKNCHKVTLHELGLLKVHPKKQNNKLRGSLDLKEVENTSKKPIKCSTPGHNNLFALD